jgi:hypothetical protein
MPLKLDAQPVPEVALELDHVTAQRAAGAASSLQLTRKGCEGLRRSLEAGDERDNLAAAALAVTQQADDTVARQIERFGLGSRNTSLIARAAVEPLAAGWTAPRLDGV